MESNPSRGIVFDSTIETAKLGGKTFFLGGEGREKGVGRGKRRKEARKEPEAHNIEDVGTNEGEKPKDEDIREGRWIRFMVM